MGRIVIPFTRREYQKPLTDFILNGGKRAFVEWHRRAGKDICLWNLMFRMALEKVGLYYYFLPTYTQGKKIIWDGITIDGIAFKSFIPKELKLSEHDQEMKIKLKNGSIMQIIGTDKYDAIRGTNPIGCVFSEYAYQNPQVWDVIRPILKINGGWAAFNTTPNGENHSHDLGKMASMNPEWFYEVLTVEDTGILTEKDIEDERKEGMSEAAIQREYYCSHDVEGLGAIYARQMKEAKDKGRIGLYPYVKGVDVHVVPDLGRADTAAFIFFQKYNGEIRIMDYYENTGEDVGHYVEKIKEKNYSLGFLFLPHDAYAKRMDSKATIEEQFRAAGFRTQRVENLSIENGIQEARKIFNQVVFNEEPTKALRRALKHYHYEYDILKKTLKNSPEHDWSSHPSDAFRYMAISVGTIVEDEGENYNYDVLIKQIF